MASVPPHDAGSSSNARSHIIEIYDSLRGDDEVMNEEAAPIIRKVENDILSVDDTVYRPCYVAIGPCNLGRDFCRLVEKQVCLAALLNLSYPDGHERQPEQLRPESMVVELEQKRTTARGFYPPLDGVNEECRKFLHMLVLDGCYVLHRFLKMQDIVSWTPDRGGINWKKLLRLDTDASVVCDVLYVFENQIPFDVLDTLYLYLVRGTPAAEELPLIRLMAERVIEDLKWQKFVKLSQQARQTLHDKLLPQQQQQQNNHQQQPPVPWKHLLELVHWIITNGWRGEEQETTEPDDKDRETTNWHRVTFYDDFAAVSLVQRPLDGIRSCSILDVHLGRCSGRLQIPPLTVDDETMTMLLNLMVLELYDQGGRMEGKKNVTSYCFFLSKIAREVPDVLLLSKKLILGNKLRNDKVAATKMSNITIGFFPSRPSKNYLHETAQVLHSRLHSRVFQSISWLKANNMRNPAMAVLSLSGLAILVCTIVQAVYAIKSDKHSNN